MNIELAKKVRELGNKWMKGMSLKRKTQEQEKFVFRKGKQGIRILICFCAAVGWIGILYPELALTPDTYKIILEENAENNLKNYAYEDNYHNVYLDVLSVPREQIRYKSKLLSLFEEYMEK